MQQLCPRLFGEVLQVVANDENGKVLLQALAHLKHLTASIPPPEECFAHGRIASDASILAVVTDPAVDVIRLLRDPVDAERGGVRRASATRMPGRQGSFTPLLLDPGAVSVELLRRLRSAARLRKLKM